MNITVGARLGRGRTRLTLAVMREMALGSGKVLGMLLQSCHMKLRDRDRERGREETSAVSITVTPEGRRRQIAYNQPLASQ